MFAALKAAVPWRKGSISLLQSRGPESPWQGGRPEFHQRIGAELSPAQCCPLEHDIAALSVFRGHTIFGGVKTGTVLAFLKPKAKVGCFFFLFQQDQNFLHRVFMWFAPLLLYLSLLAFPSKALSRGPAPASVRLWWQPWVQPLQGRGIEVKN